jgi:uncharacterized protein
MATAKALAARGLRLDPILQPGIYVYCALPFDADLQGATLVATIRETEGLSVILPEQEASARGWKALFRTAWIQFGLVSALDAVGVTATVSATLAAAGISCNMVAGAYHDHVFVPVERASEALDLLNELRINLANKE